jgi:two-component system, cell cycle sensor histidine kinase and response regulator CckA
MRGQRGDWGPSFMRLLIGPSERIEGEENRTGARLLAVLALVHLLAVVLCVAAGVNFSWHMASDSLLSGPVGPLLLAATLLVLASYLLVRSGRYHAAIGVYITTAASFPLLVPFVGSGRHDVGLLATAFIPMVITATLLSRRWLVRVTLAIAVCAAAELPLVSWPPGEVLTGFSILLAVLASSGLLLVLRRHQGKLELLRAEQLRQSEAALRISQERLQAMVGVSRDLIVVLDAKGARKAVFGAIKEMTGYDPSTRGEFSYLEAIHPDDRERVGQELAELTKKPGQVGRTEFRYLHADGRYRWQECLATNRLGQEGIDGIVVDIRDISERKAAEEALLRNERRYRTLFETITDEILLIAADGQLIDVNDTVCRMLGYTRDELLSMRIEDVLPPEKSDHPNEINRLLADKGRLVFEASHRRKDGTVFPIEVAASVADLDGKTAYLAVVRDITERVAAEEGRRRLQEQLQHAVKMEAVGRLAGGVAHDFNNLLTAILGNIDLASLQLEEGGDVREALSEIRGAALSAATVTRQLLAFVRKHVVEPRSLDLNEVLRHMSKMIERLIGEDVHLRTVEGEGLGVVRADPGLIEQAIINLAVNARDAMPSGGALVIETSNVSLDSTYVRTHPLALCGRYVMIAVSDTGGGMSDEVKRHLFEPFFTTKPYGKGTGLGLATTYAAVQQCGGSIEAYSEKGKGTTFRIYLPVAAGKADTEAELPAARTENGKLSDGGETILVVEDDKRVRDMVAQTLRVRGYDVLVASNGEAALAMGVSRKTRIHLLLTDVVMPGLNGRELADLLLKIHPETHALLTSGYTENIIAEHGSLEAGIEFLGKPYTMDVLVKRVRGVLDKA